MTTEYFMTARSGLSRGLVFLFFVFLFLWGNQYDRRACQRVTRCYCAVYACTSTQLYPYIATLHQQATFVTRYSISRHRGYAHLLRSKIVCLWYYHACPHHVCICICSLLVFHRLREHQTHGYCRVSCILWLLFRVLFFWFVWPQRGAAIFQEKWATFVVSGFATFTKNRCVDVRTPLFTWVVPWFY